MTDAERLALREQVSPLFELAKLAVAEAESTMRHAAEIRDRAQAIWNEQHLGEL